MRKALSLRCALVLASAVVVYLAPAAQASSYVVSNDTSFSYTGTVTDPTGATTAIPGYTDNGVTYTGRDASIYVTRNAPISITGAGWQNATTLMTAWYPTLTPANGYGWGNPNNSDTGFFQLYDVTNNSVTSATGHWDATLTQFTLNITGSGAGYNQYARLWDAPNVGGAASDTAGTFETYNLSLVATFADPATEELPGWYATEAAPMSVTGSLTGTFLNQSPNTALNGLYTYDLTFQNQNWASAVGASFTGTSYFGAAVPEPATWAMFLVGFGLLGFMLRGSRQKAVAFTA